MLVEPIRSVFVSHGAGPFPLLNDPTHAPLYRLLENLTECIQDCKFIILISAHWETSQPTITGTDNPGIFYDYEDQRELLPKEAFTFDFPTPGSAKFADEIAKCLSDAGLQPTIDTGRGWDHAVLVPMVHLRPEWDIPIVQMSVVKGSNDEETTRKCLDLGDALRLLPSRGYLILGSGSSSHDFLAIQNAFMSGQSIESRAWRFEEELLNAAVIANPDERRQELMKWRSWKENTAAHLPGHLEHLMPFMIAAASAGDAKGRQIGLWDLAGSPQSMYVW